MTALLLAIQQKRSLFMLEPRPRMRRVVAGCPKIVEPTVSTPIIRRRGK